MISHETARKMAVKFFRAYGYSGLADDVEAAYCVNEIFARAVKHLGKKKVCDLYWRLPTQLHVYFTIAVTGSNNARLWNKICDVDNKYIEVEDSERPERLKCFPAYFAEKRGILIRYFKTGVCASERK